MFTAANSLALSLVPIPEISDADPSNVFNLLEFRTLTIHGSNFVESLPNQSDLICIFAVEHRTVKIAATYLSEGMITCETAKALRYKRNGSSILVQVSNDGGVTLSAQSFEVTFIRDLPRLLTVVEPELFFADA